MKQYCRYCINCVYGDWLYCKELEILMDESKAKRVNRCRHFKFCEVDVFDIDHAYKPRQKSELAKSQIKWDWRHGETN